MRVKLQLVLCSDEGQEETVTDVITLNKNSQRIEHLGLTLAEAKQLLSTLQRHLLQQQVDSLVICVTRVFSRISLIFKRIVNIPRGQAGYVGTGDLDSKYRSSAA